MVRLTDRPDMTLDVYRGRKTTMQQQQQILSIGLSHCLTRVKFYGYEILPIKSYIYLPFACTILYVSSYEFQNRGLNQSLIRLFTGIALTGMKKILFSMTAMR